MPCTSTTAATPRRCPAPTNSRCSTPSTARCVASRSTARHDLGPSRLHFVAIAAAAAEGRAVLHRHREVAIRDRLYFAHAVNIHHRAPMHAHEARGIQARGETAQRLADEVRLSGHVQREVVALALYPLDLVEIQVTQAAAILDGDGPGTARGQVIEDVHEDRERAEREGQ